MTVSLFVSKPGQRMKSCHLWQQQWMERKEVMLKKKKNNKLSKETNPHDFIPVWNLEKLSSQKWRAEQRLLEAAGVGVGG